MVQTPSNEPARLDSTTIVFLDFDGVIRDPIKKPSSDILAPEFCAKRMKLVADACNVSGARVVVTSDWRHLESQEQLEKLLSPHIAPILHPDWATPVTGHRWNGVQAWLLAHPEVEHYVILEDFEPHFYGCSDEMLERIVWCDTKEGVNVNTARAMAELLGCGEWRFV